MPKYLKLVNTVMSRFTDLVRGKKAQAPAPAAPTPPAPKAVPSPPAAPVAKAPKKPKKTGL